MNSYPNYITAIITPMEKDGSLDLESLSSLAKWQIDEGVEAFVINGTTGESPVLKTNEVIEVFNCVKEATNNKVPLILGVGRNCTRKTCDFIDEVKHLDPHSYLVVTPYYNKPTQLGLIGHFETIANHSSKPVLLYNVPGRTITSISSKTVSKLSRNNNVIGIKDATGDINVLQKLLPIKENNPEFVLLSGDDGTTADFIAQGGQGVISVLSHVIPKEFKEILAQANEDIEGAIEKFEKYKTLTDLLFVQANPIPVKTALYLMGKIKTPNLRLPLTTLSEEATERLESELRSLSII